MKSTYFFAISIFFIFISVVNSNENPSIHGKVSYDQGINYSWNWSGSVAVTTLGMVLNGIFLYLLLTSENKYHIPLYPYILSLIIVDFIMCIYSTLKNALALSTSSVFHHNAGCESEAIINFFLFVWSVCILSLIAYTTKLSLCYRIELTHKQVYLSVIACGFYSAITSILPVFVPGGGYVLFPSGTWCLWLVKSPTSVVIAFVLGNMLPGHIMMDSFQKIYSNISKAQSLLNHQGKKMEVQAKAKYVSMIKKLVVFVFIINFCELPLIIVMIYEWITDKLPPPELDAFGGIAALLSPSIFNPILFFILNYQVQDNFIKKYGNFFKLITFRNQTIDIEKGDRDDCILWLHDEELFQIFYEYAKKQYVTENLLFYQDIQKYHKLGKEINKILTMNAIESTSVLNNLQIKEINDLWTEFYENVCQIYSLYIEVPTAPLEINLQHIHREEINNTLNITEQSIDSTEKIIIPKFRDLLTISRTEQQQLLNKIVTVFDNAEKNIVTIIETDIFPRFSKSTLFAKAKSQHILSGMTKHEKV